MLCGQLVGIPLIFIIDWLIKKSGTRHEGAPIEDTVTAVSIFIVSVMCCCVVTIMMFNGKLERRCAPARFSRRIVITLAMTPPHRLYDTCVCLTVRVHQLCRKRGGLVH